MKWDISQRTLKIVLAAVFLLVSFIASFAAVLHNHAVPKPGMSERILITPGEEEQSQAGMAAVPTPTAAVAAVTAAGPESAETASEEKPPEEQISDSPQTFQLGRLLAKGVTVTPYELKARDNYWTVADHHGINLYTLLGANPTLPFKAYLGQTLLLLSQRGVLHEVYPNDTLKKIAIAYQVDVKAILDANTIHWWRGIRPGDVLFIPGAKPIRMADKWRAYFDQRGFFGVPFSRGGEAITSGFGWRIDPINGKKEFHTGLDFRAKYGKSVFAAATGRVTYAGVAGGYGNLIIVYHNKEYRTYYGHLSSILVKAGERVRRGQLIGKVGETGHATGPHLHFEIRKYGKPIDPLPLI
ncbi:MAG TPA: LysM peptidoglycan-binding domain-containing M23 family metallopeptidase [bacterium]|nr:LysM peptidoglycan-binding domain-containing M23 family metallopeptidase [bacterium]